MNLFIALVVELLIRNAVRMLRRKYIWQKAIYWDNDVFVISVALTQSIVV